MGLEVATVALIAVAAGATVGKMSMEYEAAQQKEKALDLQGQQLQLQNQQKQLGNLDMMEKVLDAQASAMTTRGVAFTSPSYNAIQRATLNIGAKKQANTTIEGNLAMENLDIEKQNVRTTLYAQLFGDVANVAFTAASMGANAPKGGGGGAAAASSLPAMGE